MTRPSHAPRTQLTLCTLVSLVVTVPLASCQETTPAPAPPPPAAQPKAPAPAATGTVKVTAAKAFPFAVLDAKSDTQVAKGTCNSPGAQVPAGDYRVSVTPGDHPTVALGAVKVAAGQTATLKLGGYGRLKVRAVKDFLKFTVADQQGTIVGKGDTNISTLGVPAGEHTITVAMGELPAATITKVAITDGQETVAELKGYATLKVDAVKDFLKFTVADQQSKVVGKGDTRISTLLLPVGEYQVRVTVPGFPEATIDKVVLQEGAKQTATLEGYATLKVGASKDFLKWALQGKDGAAVAKGDTNITTVVVPAGSYTLTVDGKAAGAVTLKSGDRTTQQSGR